MESESAIQQDPQCSGKGGLGRHPSSAVTVCCSWQRLSLEPRARAGPRGRHDRHPRPTDAEPKGQTHVCSLCLSFSICDLGTRRPLGRCEGELKPSKALAWKVVSAHERLHPGDFFFEWSVVGQVLYPLMFHSKGVRTVITGHLAAASINKYVF